MAIELVTLKCPECGASLSIEAERQTAFCTYCGAKVIVHNDNEYTYRHIDEAKIKQAEHEHELEMKRLKLKEEKLRHEQELEKRKLEIKEAKAQRKRHLRKILTIVWLVASAIILGIGIVQWVVLDQFLFAFNLLGWVGVPVIGGGAYLIFSVLGDEDYDEEEALENGGIRFPRDFSFGDTDYRTLAESLEAAGFTDVTTVSKHDMILGLSSERNKVESITIDGKSIYFGGKVYPADAAIVITYHGR